MICWRVAIFVVGVASASLASDGFNYLGNRIGHADIFGSLSVWCEPEAWNLPLSESEELPLRAQFTSAPPSLVRSAFGEGWAVPLLESCLVEESEAVIRWMAPGGELIYLTRRSTEEESYNSLNGRCRGERDGDRFKIENSDGWTFHYNRGRISKVVAPSGVSASWKYQGEMPVEIVRSDGTVMLAIEYDHETGLARKLRLPKGTCGLKYDRMPVSGAQSVGITSIRPTVARIVFGDKCLFSLSPRLQETGVMEANISTEEGKEEKVSWNPRTKHVLSDGTATYQIVTKAPSMYPEIVRERQAGGRLSYFFDSERMTSVLTDSSGLRVERRFLATPGPSFMKLRSLVAVLPTGAIEEERYSYDQDGKLMRTVHKFGDGKTSGVTEEFFVTPPDGQGNIQIKGESVEGSFNTKASEGSIQINGQKYTYKNGMLHYER